MYFITYLTFHKDSGPYNRIVPNAFPRSLRWDSIVVCEVWSVSAISLDDRKGSEETRSDKESFISDDLRTRILGFQGFRFHSWTFWTKVDIPVDIDRTFTFLNANNIMCRKWTFWSFIINISYSKPYKCTCLIKHVCLLQQLTYITHQKLTNLNKCIKRYY